MIVIAGASRVSSVSGLNEIPKKPIDLPLTIFKTSCTFCTTFSRC